MSRSYIRIVVAAATAVALVASPAAADVRRVGDADDAKGVLDIKWVSHGHGMQARQLRHRITTFERWGSKKLDCAAMGIVFKGRDRYLRLYYEGEVKAEMLDTANDLVVGYAKVWRPNGRSVTVQFPKRWLGSSATRYRWSARTETYGDRCPPFDGDPPEFRDLAPDSGFILHALS